MNNSYQSIDIVAIFQRYTRLAPASHTGKQWYGACPFSDCSADEDGFVVWPTLTRRGCHYYCRGCGRAGDVLAFLCAYEEISRRRACQMLAIPYEPHVAYAESDLPDMAPDDPPPHAWQLRATTFARVAMEHLWSQEGLPARAYLHQRGFTDATIQQAQLGYHPTTCSESATTWGLVNGTPPQKVWLPRGIVIPWYAGAELWKLNIRRGDKDIERDLQEVQANGKRRRRIKYVEVLGSADFLYGIDALASNRPVVLLESELDVLAARQAGTQELASCLATGSTGRGRTPHALSVLAQASYVLVAFDNDANKRGEEAAEWWLRTLPHATRYRPWGHDINEMLQKQQDIRIWVSCGLETPLKALTLVAEDTPLSQDERQEQRSSAQGHTQGDALTPPAAEECPPGEIPEPSLVCLVCGAEVEYYSAQGIAYCVQHWIEASASATSCTPLRLVAELQELERQWSATPPTHLVLSLQTTGPDPRNCKMVALTFGLPDKVTIIDLRDYCAPWHPQAWRETLLALVRQDVLWIGHNLKSAWLFLAQQLGVPLQRVYDTSLVERLLHAGEQMGETLQASAERYGITSAKESSAWFSNLDTRPSEWDAPFPEVQLRSLYQDGSLPFQLYERQQAAIAHYELARVVSLEQQALPAIAAMELHGICVDVAQWRSILASRVQQKQELEAQIKPVLEAALASVQSGQETLFGVRDAPTIHLTSSPQTLQALRILGVNVAATSKEALQKVQAQHPIIPLLLEWKRVEKFTSAFGESVLSYVASDGRIHATFEQLGAASGRIVCHSPNLQQIPKATSNGKLYDLRRCFVVPQGHTFLIADLSNIELRILAEVSGDETMLRFFAEGKDLHSETARLMFKLPDDADPKTYEVNGKKARDIAKTINFGLAYGMGALGLVSRVGVDLKTAQGLMHTYFATYPAVAAYLARSGKEGAVKGYARSLSGRRRSFSRKELNTQHGEVERCAKNHPIQGTNADILKHALIQLYHQLPTGVHIVLTVHDEILLECPIACIEVASRTLQDVMLQACRAYLHVVSIPPPDVLAAAHW